jgi:small subunit ribosomal protein S8
MSIDPFSDAMIHIKNSDFVAKKECRIMPATKILDKVLEIFKAEKYIDDFSRVKEKNKQAMLVKLNGNITNCKAIKPRFSVDNAEYEKFEKDICLQKEWVC